MWQACCSQAWAEIHGNRVASNVSPRVDQFKYRVTTPNAEIQLQSTVGAQPLQSLNVRCAQVVNVDVAADARPVSGRIVVAE
jgi:hypothetical protein